MMPSTYFLIVILSVNSIMIKSLISKRASGLFSNSMQILARKPVQPASGPLSTTSAAVDVLKIDEAPYPTTKKKRTDKKLPKDGHFYCKPTDVLNSTYTTNACKFTVFGEPIALSRHRVTRGGIMYNPSAKFQADFLLACSSYLPPTPLEGSIAVNMVFYFSRPKNHYGTGKNANVLKNTADVWHAKRSDIDNLAKFVLDALNSVAYKDDCQVSILHIAKLYTDSEPGVQVHIKKLEEGTLHDTLSNLWE